MKTEKKKLRLSKETISALNSPVTNGQNAKPGFDYSYISKTEGTINHCKSYPFDCGPTVY